MSTLEKAIEIAAQAHAGQVDKAGEPYILHVMRVVLACPPDNNTRIVAALHDVLEDCYGTSIDLLKLGFTISQVEAVVRLTKLKGENYDSYIRRLSIDPLARRVKLYDLADNLDRSRIQNPTSADEARWLKYENARRYLLFEDRYGDRNRDHNHSYCPMCGNRLRSGECPIHTSYEDQVIINKSLNRKLIAMQAKGRKGKPRITEDPEHDY